MIHLIVFFLILFIRLQNAKCFKIHEFPTNCIDLFIHITTEFTYKESRTRTRDNIFYDELFEEFDTRTRAKEFDKIQDKKLEIDYTGQEYIGNSLKSKDFLMRKGKLYIYFKDIIRASDVFQKNRIDTKIQVVQVLLFLDHIV
jgi:hypothetical protein